MTNESANPTRRWLRLLAVVLSASVAVAACGSGDGDETAVEDTATDDSAVDETTTTTAAPAEDTAEDTADETADDATDDTAEDASDDTADDAAADSGSEAAEGAITVDLAEFSINMPAELTAGTNSFAVNNVGSFPHALAVARGTSYEELPQLENGAVDTDALGDDYLGTTDNLDGGMAATIDFDLEAGDYVFFCPVAFGDNSHAASGQVLSVTVS